ncbi:MAG: sigma-70 family RNA polymerase sigma factor [Actinomycetota bacterium]
MRDDETLDLELHRRIRGKDAGAFEELYKRYSSAIYGLALRVTGHGPLAQEVVNDAFLAVWRAPEAYDPARGSLRTFLMSLSHHRAVDAVRKEERLRKRTQRALNLDETAGEDVAEGVVEDAWLADRRKLVKEALVTLPPDQRQVLEMAYFGGLTQAKIADQLSIPLGTVKTRTLAAMRKMRAALSEDDG